MLETINGCQSVETIVAAVVLICVLISGGFAGADLGLLVEKVCVRVDDLTTLTALGRCLPREILQSLKYITMMMAKDKLRP